MPKVKETWMDGITTEMMEYICDDLCSRCCGEVCGQGGNGMKINVTITLYLEVKDAALFGGMGKVGYARSNFDFKTDDLSTIDIETVGKCTIQEYAEFLKTPEENIRIISREEYEENTEGEQ